MLKIYANEKLVGRAKITREGNHASLTDITISNFSVKIFWMLPWWKKRFNYQGLGYGTALLLGVLEYCRNHGIMEVTGKAVGDLTRLIPWYRKHGFEVDDLNNIRIRF